MRWRGRRASSNIEDRRGGGFSGGFGRSPGRIPVGFPRTRRAGVGGLGIGGVIVLLVIAWVAGVNPLELLGGGTSPMVVNDGGQDTGRTGVPDDEGARFVAVVLADTEDTWGRIFSEGGTTYREPTLVLFEGRVSSACGMATSAAGPFYCPGDQRVYIDLAFYDELRSRYSAPGDFAQAYVIAHEVGHHVQNLLGILPKVHEARRSAGEVEANQLSVRLELQADCYAGVWAADAEARDILEVGDIDEALNAAAQIGDDTLQRQSQGHVVPDSFTHGSAAQRSRWFRRGYETGDMEACDTFTPRDV